MSTVLYPLSGYVARVRTETFARNIVDRFEDGTEQSRRLWAANTFKRRFSVAHSALTRDEFEYLRAFYTARSGDFDPFLFRNNAERLGNHYVRFARPLQRDVNAAALRSLSVELQEVQLQRELPTAADVVSAAGSSPLVWLDANREIIHQWKGTWYNETAAYDASGVNTYAPTTNYPSFYGVVASSTIYPQSSAYSASPTFIPKSAGNVTLSGSSPRLSIFMLVRAVTSISNGIVVAVGNHGIELRTDSKFYPYVDSVTYSSGATNTGTLAWHSLCVTWNNSTEAKTYLDGALIATEADARTYTAGKLSFGALPDETLGLLDGVTYNNVLLFNATLTLAQIKALHNLVGWQVGLAEVS